jgi:hypothetical protein
LKKKREKKKENGENGENKALTFNVSLVVEPAALNM